ncbi:S8 family peptidase [Actinophytocola sp. KF-1]
MCDFVPGEVMLAHPAAGPGAVIFERIIGDLFWRDTANFVPGRRQRPVWQEDGSEELLRHGKPLVFPMPDGPPMLFHRLPTTRGGEQAAVADFNRLTLEFSVEAVAHGESVAEVLSPRQQVFAQPVHRLRPCHDDGGFGSAEPFRLTGKHQEYLDWIGGDSADGTGKVPKVAVIDGGFDARFCPDGTFSASLPEKVDFVGHEADPAAAHGTLVATLIDATCPGADLLALRIMSGDGTDGTVATEWTLFEAVKEALDRDVDIINLSMNFGINTQECATCGDLPRAARSPAFELLVKYAAGSPDRVVVVVAAGNERFGRLAFPSRFAASVAVSAVNGAGAPSHMTNYDGDALHPLLFAAPGGDLTDSVDEAVAESDDWSYRGTSFAAAYTSGALAGIMVRNNVTAAAALVILKQDADTGVAGFDPKYHGNGVIRIT